MANAIKSGSGSSLQDIDPISLAARNSIYGRDGNRVSKKQRDLIADSQEFLLIAGKNDSFSTGIRTDRKGNILTGNYIPELIENFEGAVVNVQKWTQTSTTFVAAQSTASGYLLNSTALTTINAIHTLQSQRVFYKFPRVPIQVKTRLRANIPTNSTFDTGLGLPVGTTLIVPNGVAIRCVNGLWTAAITSNGVELLAVNINDYSTGLIQFSTANLNNEFYVVDYVIDDDNMLVTIQNTQTGVMVGYAQLPVPLSALKMFAATALPQYSRLFNAGTPPTTAPNVTIGETQVLSLDMNINMDASQIAGNLGMTAGRNPFTGAQLENHVNSTAPTSATLSNTAAGYTTLGGKFQFVATAGAATDFVLFGFQVPLGLKFLCEGVRIVSYNTGAVVGTTATLLEWAMGFNSAAVSLATANIIRRQVGVQSFAIGAAIGATSTDLDTIFTTPEVTESGRFVSVIVNSPIGTATAAQIIRGQIRIKGRFI